MERERESMILCVNNLMCYNIHFFDTMCAPSALPSLLLLDGHHIHIHVHVYALTGQRTHTPMCTNIHLRTVHIELNWTELLSHNILSPPI